MILPMLLMALGHPSEPAASSCGQSPLEIRLHSPQAGAVYQLGSDTYPVHASVLVAGSVARTRKCVGADVVKSENLDPAVRSHVPDPMMPCTDASPPPPRLPLYCAA